MTRLRARLVSLVALAAAGGLGVATPAVAQVVEPRAETCPESLPSGTRCWSGRAESGAWYWYARPADWNGQLILHAHGGPRTGAPERGEPEEDLDRFSMMVAEGYAWAGSTYRRGGYGVRMAAEDTDQLRQIVWDQWGKPERTLLHGQSWGGNVAAKAAELHAVATDGTRSYDGVLLTSGVLGGGTRAYGFRADLRAVYQVYCANHPRPDEVQYPLWQGLPEGASMSRAELSARLQACTGVGLPDAERTPEQRARLRNIRSVTGLEEEHLLGHLAWATNLFQDLVWERLNGGNPFDNTGRTYRGSDEDAALNQSIQRFAADPAAVATLAYDADLTGQIVVPTVTLHARYDPTVFVEHSGSYAQTVAQAGRSHLLAQFYTTETVHSRLNAPQYVALLRALDRWLDDGERPTPQAVVALCEDARARHGETCLIDPDFRPEPLP
ncbi:alpha/beta hydrolase family protein [Brevundimonas aurifodinae]|uniref:Alpha/beta hydrolase n=1 Tax=Brevundimonas aurifodinae TaxID=1508312 RepID=A0ABV1NMQ6_9CAUL